jgi:molybdenum cofactor cytidylyltransferase
VITGIVLAAGPGTRFGGGKQLAELDGRPLLEHALGAMAASGVDRMLVVLGAAADEVQSGIHLHGAEPVLCQRWEEGKSASLACGLAAAPDADAVVVTLGDQPRVPAEAINRVVAARGEGAAAARATYDGEPGYPLLVEHELLGRLRNVSGDHGARNVLASVVTREVPCDDLGGGEDVDTRAQLDALRAELGS